METKIVDMNNVSKGKVNLPKQFSELVRPDLVKRAVFAIQSHNAQPHGAKPDAGMRASAEISRRRRKYKGSYGYGISRVPRKIMSSRGTRFSWTGAIDSSSEKLKYAVSRKKIGTDASFIQVQKWLPNASHSFVDNDVDFSSEYHYIVLVKDQDYNIAKYTPASIVIP